MYLGLNMAGVESHTLEHVCDKTKNTRHAILIDPADQTPDTAAKRAVAAVAAGSKMILVGGSSGTDMNNVNNTVVAISFEMTFFTFSSMCLHIFVGNSIRSRTIFTNRALIHKYSQRTSNVII